jgi:ADP-ribose pyrophosphatase YjhB (NUDIX family)
MIHLATGIVVRNECLLMVASRYPNQPEPLWNLPGGRQKPRELLEETVVREFYEETGLRVAVRELAYVSESYDGDRHFLNTSFLVEAIDSSFDPSTSSGQAKLRMTSEELTMRPGDHVVAVKWVPRRELRERIVVAVVREPLVAYLEGRLEMRYAGFHEAGITIEWPDDSA